MYITIDQIKNIGIIEVTYSKESDNINFYKKGDKLPIERLFKFPFLRKFYYEKCKTTGFFSMYEDYIWTRKDSSDYIIEDGIVYSKPYITINYRKGNILKSKITFENDLEITLILDKINKYNQYIKVK